MISFNSLADSNTVLVADTSVLINLNAAGCAVKLLANLPCSLAVPSNVYAELDNGRALGHRDADSIDELYRLGHASQLDLGPVGFHIYNNLVDGTTIGTLDDGEAAVIGISVEISGTALIDERKARKFCAELYPDLPMINTVELLLSSNAKEILGIRGQAEAILNAKKNARMHVPESNKAEVSNLLGNSDSLD